ncbi:hypothetical protein L249_0700 [Ophiocordyceps polyrhachis-furcata BCC 54312]|uniref:Uncharacterized protein n=1 Tax=Ophiocordyceps polyrhachis-furcata BCC 54312 TaxID=1330021 RepID=A0A367LEK5_9HYPO|nr:hypothetical protein L249_0700 [Ophiocordyceps polyrhachis-furcata BCC 54312]
MGKNKHSTRRKRLPRTDHGRQIDRGIRLCQACKMSVHGEEGVQLCPGCKSGMPRTLSGEFLTRLRDQLARRDDTIFVRWLNGKGRVVHHGTTDPSPTCDDKARRAEMCDVLTLYAFKHGWAAWGLQVAAKELLEPGTRPRPDEPPPYQSRQRRAEDDGGQMTDWCSCDNQKLESSAQTLSLSSEVAVGKLPADRLLRPDTTGEQWEFAYERSTWTGATPQIMADALWLAGPGRRRIAEASANVSREVIKGARGSAETVLLHYLFMNNHAATLTGGLELLLLGTYLAALDHGRVRDGDFAAFAADVARHASLGRWVIAADELLRRWPGIMDWHGGCLATLGLTRGLELRGWVYAAHWDVVMHYELGSGTDREEKLPRSAYIGAVLGHDAGDLCSDTRRGCADNSLLAVGAHSGWEGVAACLDVVCDALEAVVLRDTRGAIDVGLVAGSGCATFERTGGRLCACAADDCEAMTVLAWVSGDLRLSRADAAALTRLRDSLRSRQAVLPPRPDKSDDDGQHLQEHESRERVYAEATMALASGVHAADAHRKLQDAYAAVARAMCGAMRRRAALFRRRVTTGGGAPLDLSRGCLCGGECIDWR